MAREAEAGGSHVQSWPQQEQSANKQLSETLSLNKIQNRAEDVAQWSSAPEFNLGYLSTTEKNLKSAHNLNEMGSGSFPIQLPCENSGQTTPQL